MSPSRRARPSRIPACLPAGSVDDNPTAGGLGVMSVRAVGGPIGEETLAVAKTTGWMSRRYSSTRSAHERPDECPAAMDLELVAGLTLQLGDLHRHIT